VVNKNNSEQHDCGQPNGPPTSRPAQSYKWERRHTLT